jgi:stage V sporulation protein B
MKESRKYFFDIGWVLFSSVLNMIVGFFLRPFLARWLGVDDLGIYSMIITIKEFATLIATIGISASVVKFIAESKDDTNQISQISSSGLINSIVLSIFGAVVLYFFSGTIAKMLNMPELVTYIKIFAISLPPLCIIDTVTGLLNGLREMKERTYLLISNSVLMAILTLGPALLGFGIRGVVIGLVIVAFSTSALAIFYMRKHVIWDLANYKLHSRKILTFGWWILSGNIMSVIARQVDIMMVGHYLGTTQVGYYSAASTLSQLFFVVPGAMQAITYPATATYLAKGKKDDLQNMLDKSVKYATCILLPVALGVVIFRKEIITLIFGQKFIEAASALMILVIARVIYGGTTTSIASTISASGRPQLMLVPNFISIAINIGLGVILIPRFGITGASIATATALMVWTMIFFILVVRVMHINFDFRWFFRAIGSTCIAAIIFVLGVHVINMYILGACIICVQILFILRFLLTHDDREMIKSLICSIISR